MEPSAYIMGAVILGGLGLYYWYSFGRHGGMGGYQKHQFQLKEGESLVKFFFGSYHLEAEKKDIALALVNVERVGQPLQFGITDLGRLIFREHAAMMADEPISLEKNQVKEVKILPGEFSSLVGLTGKLEKMRTVEIALNDGNVIKVDTANSCGEAIVEWAKG